MPPIPAPGIEGDADASASFSGKSVIKASVVKIIAATLTAFCRASLTTLTGSMMPKSNRSPKRGSLSHSSYESARYSLLKHEFASLNKMTDCVVL